MYAVTSPLKQFAARAFARPGVRKAYRDLADEFGFIDEVLRARAAAGLTQAEVAARVGTTQSAIARLESAHAKHSPSLATLRRYAEALGCRIEIRLVMAKRPHAARRNKSAHQPPRRSPQAPAR
jgi:transcriptional regulator with XRE-family HTH domain